MVIVSTKPAADGRNIFIVMLYLHVFFWDHMLFLFGSCGYFYTFLSHIS